MQFVLTEHHNIVLKLSNYLGTKLCALLGKDIYQQHTTRKFFKLLTNCNLKVDDPLLQSKS